MAEDQKQFLEQIQELFDSENRAALQSLLADNRSSDISEVVELLDSDQRRVVFDVLDKHIAAEVLEKVDEATRASLFDIFGEAELRGLISELDPDDAADVLAELPEEER